MRSLRSAFVGGEAGRAPLTRHALLTTFSSPKPPTPGPLGTQPWTPHGAEEWGAWPQSPLEKRSEAVGRVGPGGAPTGRAS